MKPKIPPNNTIDKTTRDISEDKLFNDINIELMQLLNTNSGILDAESLLSTTFVKEHVPVLLEEAIKYERAKLDIHAYNIMPTSYVQGINLKRAAMINAIKSCRAIRLSEIRTELLEELRISYERNINITPLNPDIMIKNLFNCLRSIADIASGTYRIGNNLANSHDLSYKIVEEQNHNNLSHSEGDRIKEIHEYNNIANYLLDKYKDMKNYKSLSDKASETYNFLSPRGKEIISNYTDKKFLKLT